MTPVSVLLVPDLPALQAKGLEGSVLRLSPLGHPAWPCPGAAWVQHNLKASRKVVQPTLAGILEGL